MKQFFFLERESILAPVKLLASIYIYFMRYLAEEWNLSKF
jgi:hypothetical protein